MSNILGIIPARIGSKRVSNKNFRTFAGKPLVLHSLEQALNSKRLNRVIVSTNHKSVSDVIPVKFLEYFISRPDDISTDKSRGYTYVEHALTYCKELFNEEFSHFVVLPPTAPLRNFQDIDNCIDMLLNKKCDTVTSMVEVNMMYHGFKQKVIDDDDIIRPFLIEEKERTAYYELPKVFVRNCAIYASKVRVIHSKTIIGENCRAYLMPPERSVDINEMIDFEFAKFLYTKKRTAIDK